MCNVHGASLPVGFIPVIETDSPEVLQNIYNAQTKQMTGTALSLYRVVYDAHAGNLQTG